MKLNPPEQIATGVWMVMKGQFLERPTLIPLANGLVLEGVSHRGERQPGVLVLPPFYYKSPSENGLFDFYSALADQLGDGVVLVDVARTEIAGGGVAEIDEILAPQWLIQPWRSHAGRRGHG